VGRALTRAPRRLLFWLHLCAGVAAGVVGRILSATGIAFTNQRQTWFRRAGTPRARDFNRHSTLGC
jgi:hypothetical protein